MQTAYEINQNRKTVETYSEILLITPRKTCEWGWIYFNIHFILADKAGVRLHTGKFPWKE